MNKNYTKGASIFLAVMILSSLLAIGLGVTAIILPQLKITENIDDSIKAIFAADAGVERCLYNIRKEGGDCSALENPYTLANNVSYAKLESTTSCPPSNPTGYKYEGRYRRVHRALEFCY